MTKILIVAEGRHEHGGDDEEGALAILVRQLLGDPPGLSFDHRKLGDAVFARRFHRDRYRQRGKGHGITKGIVRFLKSARESGYDAVIFLMDEDGDAARRQAIDRGQETTLETLPRACGLAIRTFDAWMLADEKAIGQTLGMTVPRQPSPEGLRTPKEVCQRLRDESPCELPLRSAYAGVAGRLDIATLSDRCPAGFAPFADLVLELERRLDLNAFL